MSQILYTNILVDWSLSVIMTSKLVIRESESPRPVASSVLFIVELTSKVSQTKSYNPDFSDAIKQDIKLIMNWLVGWLCLMSHRQRGHLEMAPPFTVPCEGREAR